MPLLHKILITDKPPENTGRILGSLPCQLQDKALSRGQWENRYNKTKIYSATSPQLG